MSQEELYRRAVACPGWRWMAGAATIGGSRVLAHNEARADGLEVATVGEHTGGHCIWDVAPDGFLPDLTDPATLGCLLALVREAWDAEVMLLAEVIRSGPCAGARPGNT